MEPGAGVIQITGRPTFPMVKSMKSTHGSVTLTVAELMEHRYAIIQGGLTRENNP